MILKIGHRGAMGYEPENTLLSFYKAVALGCDMIELDVRICQSGEAVVIHDETVDRTSDGSGRIDQLTLSELKSLKFGKHQQILTLAETLEEFKGKCRFNVELKSADTPVPVTRLINDFIKAGKYLSEELVISSFNHYWLAECRKINPQLKTGLLTFGQKIDFVAYAVSFGAYSVHPDIEFIDQNLVTLAKKNGLKVFVWTVNTPDKISYVRSLGVDGVISDYPDRL